MITRFAPSPTGPLHLGHAYSALLASDMAREAGGTFVLRIEDIDQTRARQKWERQIYDDLHWLGLSWPEPVLRQSQNLNRYVCTLRTLWSYGLIYPCTCTRRDVIAASTAQQEGDFPPHGPDGLIYPGTCRGAKARAASGPMPRGVALRLDMEAAFDVLAALGPLRFTETGEGQARDVEITRDHALNDIGDVVLARRDMGTSYHLAVVIDDAAQGISHVTRGADLFDATAIHVILQRLLDLPTPVYHHHHLIRDEDGKRLAKRDDARAIATYRAAGETPDDIRRRVGLPVAR
ncbi:tRNA glutamyl-Q(34) synthetase GluQRS [Sediminimonas qiaohouensis]|uniref:tRNA glutamyl-Q(34) synthetase GluQRS n=1 Tax=Sediminimonas qiaohouensis TaxID=552061 RepID=UPI00047B3A92|nr:tRNA glutamyl-Q(34) synthetase GluQRS [Sediminimonas qiaohouensis]